MGPERKTPRRQEEVCEGTVLRELGRRHEPGASESSAGESAKASSQTRPDQTNSERSPPCR